jgi:hypothetical protein
VRPTPAPAHAPLTMNLQQPDPAMPLAPYIRVGEDRRGGCCWEVVAGDVVVQAATLKEAQRILAERWAKGDEMQTGEASG